MKLLKLLPAALLLVAASQTASAQLATQTQTLDITVSAVDVFTISSTAVTGTVAIGAASFSGGTYAIQTNTPSTTPRVIKGQITTGLVFPTALSLTVTLTGTTNATSAGPVTLLAASATDLVTAIHNVDAPTLAITFNTNASAAVDAGALAQRTITYTLQ
jgi:hypothetical protein